MVSIEKWIRLPVLPRSNLVYKTSAFAALPSRNEMAAPDGFALRQAQGLEPLGPELVAEGQAKRVETAPSTSRVRVGRSAIELQG